MPEPIVNELPITARTFFGVDNPQIAEEKSAEQIAEIKRLQAFTEMVNDENPQWYKLKSEKGTTVEGKRRYRPVNCYPCYDMARKKEVSRFAVERRDPNGTIFSFQLNCDEFMEAFEPSTPPPNLKEKKQ